MLHQDNSTESAALEVTGKTKMEGEAMRVPVLIGHPLQTGVPTVSGSIQVGVLAYRGRVDYRDALRKTGYQRKSAPSRISKLKTSLRTGAVDIPTAILLNIRDQEARRNYLRHGENGEMWLELDPGDENLDLWVVDGQHRVQALCELCGEDFEKWGNHMLHFVLLLGATEEQEMRQFYVVNSTAKSVKTGLALDLLKHQYDADGKVMDQTIREGKKWQVDGQRLVDLLFDSSPVWRGKIQLANESKGDTVIPSASFVNSLKPLVVSPYFGVLTPEQQVKILNAYWLGISKACPEPFEGLPGPDGELEFAPKDYALQKAVGVTAMHELLVVVLEHVRSGGDSPVDLESYRKIIEDVIHKLEGDNNNGEPVSGSDFWLTVSKGGAAGSFSSSAGKRVLQAKLRQQLPSLEVE